MQSKQGDRNEWHFAHVNGQERPECYAGAANLLRRLAVEQLALGGVQLPFFGVPHPLAGRAPLMWTDSFAGPLQIAGTTGSGSPQATVLLARSGQAAIYVTVGREAPPAVGEQAALWVSVPVPEGVTIRSEADARGYVRSRLGLRWLYLPETQGLLAKAQAEAADEERRLLEAFQRAEQQRALEAGRRWYSIRHGSQGQALSAGEEPPAATSPPAPRPAAVERCAREWCPGLAGRGSIQLRRMKDGTRWVYYPAGEYWRIAPAPVPFDGWDEYFPPAVAVVDGERTLRVVAEGKLLTWFGRDSDFTLIDSDPDAIEQKFGALE